MARRESEKRRQMDRVEPGREMRGLKMQEGPGEVETGAGLWAKQNFRHGSPLWAIP